MTLSQNTAGAWLTQSFSALRGAFLPVGRFITSPALVSPCRGLLGTLATPLAPPQASGQHTFEKLGQPRRRNGASSGEGPGYLLGTLASALCEMPSTVTKRAAKHRALEPRFYLRLNVGIVINILLKIPGAAVTASGLQVAS